MGGATGEDTSIGGRDVRVGPDNGRDTPVEVPSHRDLLARQLGVEVHEERISCPGLRGEQLVDGAERIALDLQVHLPAQVDHADPHPGGLRDGVSPAWIPGWEVHGADDSSLGVEQRVDVAMAVGVVAEGDHVGARLEDLLRGRLGDPDAAAGVLAVDHDQVGTLRLTELRHRGRKGLPAGLTDHVPDEEEAHLVRARRSEGPHGGAG